MFFALLAFAFSAKAQVPVFSENFDSGMPATWTQIDANNDGYGWEHSSNPASYFAAGTDLSGGGHNSSTGFVLSGSFSNVSGQAITPDNWLITPAITLTSNSDLSFWVCAQDASYAAEHYGVYITTGSGTTTTEFTLLFEETIDANGGSRVQGAWKQKTYSLASYTGQTVHIAFRHFNCNDEFVLNLDDVEILAQPTDPMIVATPSVVDFGTALLGNSKTATMNVTAYNLTAGVTATTADPFTISTDGTTYGSTASLATTGGTLYLKYTPTAVGTDNGTLTLSSTGATDVIIILSGTAMDCSNTTIPYSYNFDDEDMFNCWQIVDANNDNYTFSVVNGSCYYSYNTASAADDWLISPVFTFDGNQLVSFEYRAGLSSFPEKFQVFALGADTVALTGVVNVSNSDVETQYINLSTLTGAYSIGIHCISDADEYRLYISNFNVTALSAPDVTVTGPTSLEAGVAGTFTAVSPLADTFAWMVDGVAVPSTTETITYTFTTAGIHNVKVTVSNAYGSNTDSMDVDVYVCDAISQFPYENGFENGLPCWNMISIDPTNDGSFGILNSADYAFEGDHCFLFSSYSSASDYNQYLITPELQIPAGESYLFGFHYMGYTSDDNFKILYSTTTNDLSSFTELADFQNVAESWTETSVALPAGTKYVAIDYYGDYAYYLFVDNITIGPLTAPTVTVSGPSTVSVGSPATFTATAPLATSFAWTVDGTAVSSTTNTMTHTFTTGGNHTVAVTASNSEGSATASMTVNAFTCDQITSFPYNENFENEATLDCWIFVDADGDGFNWDPSYLRDQVDDETGQGYAHNGSYGMVASASYYSGTQSPLTPDNWLISPEIVIPANYSNVTLSWYTKGQDPSYAEEHYAVLVSTTGASTSSFTTNLYEGETTGDWEQHTANLAAYAGQTIRIAFRHYNVTDMFWLDLDDINITGVVGIDNHDMNVSVYPNPANNVLNINANSNINRVEVYNMMGQMVGMYEANDMNTQISTTALANGVYTVRIATENGTSTQKFTVAR